MSVIAYFDGALPAARLIRSDAETAARLSVKKGFTDSRIEECDAMLRPHLDARYTGVRVEILHYEDGVDLGFGKIQSAVLAKNLSRCREAFVFAVTLGHGVDRYLSRLGATSPASHFITDALASAYAEAACDLAAFEIAAGAPTAPRVSLGYGDMPLSAQPDLLSFIKADKRLHITVGASYLMTPAKSITAIMGVL